jgi:hypothetical protein
VWHTKETVPSSPKIDYLLIVISAKMTAHAYAVILAPNPKKLVENVELAPQNFSSSRTKVSTNE